MGLALTASVSCVTLHSCSCSFKLQRSLNTDRLQVLLCWEALSDAFSTFWLW